MSHSIPSLSGPLIPPSQHKEAFQLDLGLSRSQTQGLGVGMGGQMEYQPRTGTYFVRSPVTTHLPSCLLRLTLPARYYYTHFTDEGAEAPTAIKWFAQGLRPTVCRARTCLCTRLLPGSSDGRLCAHFSCRVSGSQASPQYPYPAAWKKGPGLPCPEGCAWSQRQLIGASALLEDSLSLKGTKPSVPGAA